MTQPHLKRLFLRIQIVLTWCDLRLFIPTLGTWSCAAARREGNSIPSAAWRIKWNYTKKKKRWICEKQRRIFHVFKLIPVTSAQSSDSTKTIVTKEHWNSSWSEHTSDVAVAYCTYFKTTFKKRRRRRKENIFKSWSENVLPFLFYFLICILLRKKCLETGEDVSDWRTRTFSCSHHKNPIRNC